MKRWVWPVALFVFGLCCGAILTGYLTQSSSTSLAELRDLMHVAKLERLTSDICDAGDLDSCIVALNHLAGELESLTEGRGVPDRNYDSFTADLGLTHGRLCLSYRAKGQDDLADRHYEETVRLIGSKWGIESEDQLGEMIQRIDDRARKDR